MCLLRTLYKTPARGELRSWRFMNHRCCGRESEDDLPVADIRFKITAENTYNNIANRVNYYSIKRTHRVCDSRAKNLYMPVIYYTNMK